MTMKFTKVRAGWWATEDGTAAVIVDGFGFVSQADRDGGGVLAGVTGSEWSAVIDPSGGLRKDNNSGETLDWFPTKREAVEFLKGRTNA